MLSGPFCRKCQFKQYYLDKPADVMLGSAWGGRCSATMDNTRREYDGDIERMVLFYRVWGV